MRLDDQAGSQTAIGRWLEGLGLGQYAPAFAVSYNHLWFHRDAIEALLTAGDAEGAMRHVRALEKYACAEPLLW